MYGCPVSDTPRLRHVRTFKPRKGRITSRQQRALDHRADPVLCVTGSRLDLANEFPACGDVVLEIGFGTGTATSVMARAAPHEAIIAVDVHTPGVGDLLNAIHDQQLSTVRVIEGDALDFAASRLPPNSLAGIRTYFPDPWPKARHHKRRIIQTQHVNTLTPFVRPGGFWHLATDIDSYAEQMLQVFGDSDEWNGGIVERPDWRPVTKYEAVALAVPRQITDLIYVKSSS